jgi:hypothetical protein
LQHAHAKHISKLPIDLAPQPAPAQDNWDAVLKLATDTTPSAPGSALSPPGSGGDLAPGTHVRRRVVELMEIVIRGGLVGPWTALSPLMALCTDPLEEIRSRALRMLRLLCDKHARYMDVERLCVGVDRAWAFRTDLAKARCRWGCWQHQLLHQVLLVCSASLQQRLAASLPVTRSKVALAAE